MNEELLNNETVLEETDTNKHYYYAEIDENGICFAVSDLSGEMDKPTMIALESYDVSVLGKRYENGVWVETEQPTPELQPMTDEQIAIYETQANTEYLVCLSELSLM